MGGLKMAKRGPKTTNFTKYEKYYNEGKTDIEISELCGVNRSTVASWRSKTGRESNSHGKRGPKTTNFPKYEKYYNDGMLDSEIAEMCGVAQSTVCTWRNRTGRPSNYTDTDINEKLFCQLYYLGMYPTEIAKRLRHKKGSLVNWMHRKGYYYLCPMYQEKAFEMHENGATDIMIAMTLGTTASVIGKWRSILNLKKNRTVKVSRNKHYKDFEMLDKLGYNNVQIAEMTGTRSRNVIDWRNGVVARNAMLEQKRVIL
jgi:hypothetical protein